MRSARNLQGLRLLLRTSPKLTLNVRAPRGVNYTGLNGYNGYNGG